MEKTIYFKITNKDENHHGYQYRDKLNILIEQFNEDPLQVVLLGVFILPQKNLFIDFMIMEFICEL